MQILSGSIQCAMRTTFTDVRTTASGSATTTYNDQQLLQWSWTNTPPLLVSTSNQLFTLPFTAQGGGAKTLHETSTNQNGAVHTQDGIDSWMVNCQSMLQLQVRQTSAGILLSSQDTSPPNGITLTQKLFLDNIQQGPTKMSSAPALALGVSINFGPSLTAVLHAHPPIPVTSPKPPPLSGFRISAPGAALIRGFQSASLTPPRSPDAPLPNYATTVTWTWEITTQP